MAIQDSFNLSQATSSQSYAYKCWYNYNYGGNTMNISSKDMSNITATWSGQLKNWKATATKDENKYEITDDDFTSAKAAGKNNAKEKTGFNGKKGGMIARGVVDGVAGVAGAIGTTVGKKVASNLAGKIVGKVVGVEAAKTAATEAAKKAATKATEKALTKGASEAVAKEAGKKAAEKSASASTNIGFVIAAPLALATGVAYIAKKPNKDEKEACDELQNEMMNAQAALAENQENMAEMDEELVELSEEAQIYNEDANEDIEEKKSEFDLYKTSYDALKAKADSGEALSEDEKALFTELVPLMQELGTGIEETSEDTTDTVSEIYDEMDTYQEGFDTAAETIGEVEGLTDYAEGFDEATRVMCYVEAGLQGLNAASGTQAAVQASAHAAAGGLFGLWALPFAAMGASGAAMSGVGVIQQIKWAGEVGTEIGMRKDTQSLNAEVSDVYDERIDNYEGYIENVEDLELEIPDDIETPEEGATGETGGEGSTSFGIPSKEDEKDKKEE